MPSSDDWSIKLGPTTTLEIHGAGLARDKENGFSFKSMKQIIYSSSFGGI